MANSGPPTCGGVVRLVYPMKSVGMLVCVVVVGMVLMAQSVRGQAPCSLNDVPVMDGFDVDKFLGKWYEIEWIAPTYQDNGNSWINYYHVYTADDYGVITGYYSGKDPNSGKCFLGGLTNLKTKAHPAKLMQYTANNLALIDYWVLDTNYTSYAIVYSCLARANDAANTCTRARSWLWSRTYTLPESVKVTARNAFEQLCMNMTLLYVTSFSGEDCNPDSSSSSTMCGSSPVIFLLLALMALIFFSKDTDTLS